MLFPQRSENARISVSPQRFPGTARRTKSFPRNHKKRLIRFESVSVYNFLSNFIFDEIGFGAHLAHNLKKTAVTAPASGSSSAQPFPTSIRTLPLRMFAAHLYGAHSSEGISKLCGHKHTENLLSS